MSTSLVVLFFTIGLLLSLLETRAYAYIDPGTGSYLFQIMVASLIGAGFAIKTYWSRIKKFVKNLLRKNSS
jgi:predicted Kef-type K+ transport protein